MSEYTQGLYHDGAAILKDGQPLTIEQILEGLRERDALKTHAVAVAAAVGCDDKSAYQFDSSIQVHCINNVKRFAEHLHAIERDFFMVPGEPDEDYPDAEPDDECLVNCWGSTTEQYVEQFRAALSRRDALMQAESVEQWADCLEGIIRHVETEHSKDPNYPAIGAEGMGEFAADMRDHAARLRQETEGHK